MLTPSMESRMGDAAFLLEQSTHAASCTKFVVPQAGHLVDKSRHLIYLIVEENNQNDAREIIDELLVQLRVLRNMVAMGAGGVEALERENLGEFLKYLIQMNYEYNLDKSIQVQHVTAQLLANITSASLSSCETVWQALFPEGFLHLCLTENVKTGSAIALALFNICNKVPGVLDRLADGRGSMVLSLLLQTEDRYAAVDTGEINDALGLLLLKICFHDDSLGTLMNSMGSENGSVVVQDRDFEEHNIPALLNSNHAVLLRRLDTEALDAPMGGKESNNNDYRNRSKSMEYLVTLISDVALHSVVQTDIVKQILQDSLHLLRDIYARADDGAGIAQGKSLVQALNKGGALGLLVAMLRDLGPIAKEDKQHGSFSVADKPSAKYLSSQPYEGYRSDVVSGVYCHIILSFRSKRERMYKLKASL